MEEVLMMMEREFGMPENVPAVLVGFTKHALENEQKTNDAGRPIFDDVDYVKIMVPGDKNSIVFQPAPVKSNYRTRFPKAWEAFQKQNQVALTGTPLEHWPRLTKAQALTYKAAGIPTVEAFGEVSDSNLDKLGPDARTLREQARAFLSLAEKGAAQQKAAAENQQLRDLIQLMQGQIEQLAGQIETKTGTRPDTALKVPKAKAGTPARKKRR